MHNNFNIKKLINRLLLVIAILTALIILGVVTSCKSKEVTTQTTTASDSLVSKSFNYVSRPISTNYEIQLDCDSIGNVKPISQKQTSGSNQVNLSIANNKLQAKLYTGVSKIKTDTIYKTKIKVDTSYVREYRTPLWHWLAHVIAVTVIAVLLYLQFGSPIGWIWKVLRIFTKV